jgi:hypothetical protein
LRVFFFGGLELEPKLLGWRDQKPQSPLFRHGIRRTSQYSLQETLGGHPPQYLKRRMFRFDRVIASSPTDLHTGFK